MTLTNEDLSAVSQVFQFSLQPIQTDIRSGLAALNAEIVGLKAEMAELKVEVSELKERVSVVEADIAELKSEMREVKADIAELKSEMCEVKADAAELKMETSDIRWRVTSTNLEIENNIRPQIQLLAENYVPAAKRYEKASLCIEEMQSDVDVMKKVITEHSETLQRLA